MNNFQNEIKEDYKNIYFIHTKHSKIYDDWSMYDKKILKEKKNEYFYLDIAGKGILQIYSETKNNKHNFKKIYDEYIVFLNLIETILSKSNERK